MKIGILDDNQSVIGIIRSAVENILQSNKIEGQIYTYTSYKDMNKGFESSPFDLVFLDINMPDCDGINYAVSVKNNHPNTDIAFISSKEERVFDSFKVNPIGFVRKSNFLLDISEILNRYLNKKRIKKHEEALFVSNGAKVSVNLSEVSYIEGQGVNQTLHFYNNTKNPIQISSKMEILENDLESMGFIRIHKGYIVNFIFIKSIEKNNILLLKDGIILPVSRRKSAEVKEKLLSNCEKYGILSF